MLLVSRFQTVSLSLSLVQIIIVEPVRRADAAEKTDAERGDERDDDYEEMFPSARVEEEETTTTTTDQAARSPRACTRTRKGGEEDVSPWGGTKNDTRYTRSADYHRSIDTEVRSSGNGIASTTTQSGGYFGRGEYEEEEEELEDGEEDSARFGTHGTNTQRSSYNSARQRIQRQACKVGSVTPPQATSPNPNHPRTSTSSLKASVSAESYKSFGNRSRNDLSIRKEQEVSRKRMNDARAEELAMIRRYKGGHQLLMENQNQEVTVASSYGTLDQHQQGSVDV